MIIPLQQDDVFLRDVRASASDLSNSFRLWWLGQSGFLVQYRRRHLLFDPYLSDSLTTKYANTTKPHVRISKLVVSPEKLDFIDVITSTHNHTDHLDGETLVPIILATEAAIDRRSNTGPGLRPPLVAAEANQQFIAQRLSAAVPQLVTMNAWDQQEVDHFRITAVPAAHPELTTDEFGRHTYLGFIMKAGPWVIYHSGDTMVFDGMAEGLRPFQVDIALLPINGKVGNMGGRDAARLAKDIGARLVIPCHYDMFEFNTADPYEEFVPECERIGQAYRALKLGERFSSDELPPR